MNNIAISLASLVNKNNGVFKTEKQAKFMLSQCEGPYKNGTYSYTSGSRVHGNRFMMEYFIDSKGVFKVTKQTDKKGNEVTWEREETGKITVQDEKRIRQLKRELKALEKSVASRTEAMTTGRYIADGGTESLFKMAQERDLLNIEAYKKELSKFI